ncbi:MAG: type II toxin-antitoxin system RelE/ParE family toxin [Nanoarchaeota archaeon]|nr:type II toxin-antitoxin system RelE/ParE family toxin [Nanoarchaeota archaeon]
MSKVFYSTEFVKWIKKQDKTIQKQILNKLFKLKQDPMLGKPLRNIFKDYRSLYVGKVRVIYSIKEKSIIVAKAEHRKKIYKK